MSFVSNTHYNEIFRLNIIGNNTQNIYNLSNDQQQTLNDILHSSNMIQNCKQLDKSPTFCLIDFGSILAAVRKM